MEGYDDYAAVASPIDEEEERRRQRAYPLAPPVAVAPAMPAPTGYPAPAPPASNEELSSLGYVPPKVSNQELTAMAAPPAEPRASVQRPQWEKYAPPERHGLAKFGSILAAINPTANQIVNRGPQQKAEERYKNATAEYEGGVKEPLERARTKEQEAKAAQEQAKAESLENQPDKLETTQQGYAGAIANAIKRGVDPGTDPHVKAWADAITSVQKETAPKPSERESDIKDYLAANKLEDTPANREKARDIIARRVPAAKTIVNPPGEGKATARSDKSYTYNNDKLDKLGAPIEQMVMRIGRLRETLAQNTPQADALVAPELLTIMAGGQGSGLRMNEAEIARIVGGKSQWESLKASINKWKLDPTQARSITPEQQKEIHALTEAVFGKLIQKQQALDGAREKLLTSDDPKEHRRIVIDAHRALTGIDEGAVGAGGKDMGAAPAGKKDGETGTLPDGTKVVIKGGRIVAQ